MERNACARCQFGVGDGPPLSASAPASGWEFSGAAPPQVLGIDFAHPPVGDRQHQTACPHPLSLGTEAFLGVAAASRAGVPVPAHSPRRESICSMRETLLESAESACVREATVRTACITVVWSRPPK